MGLTDYLNNRGYHRFEGYSQECQQQVDELIQLTNKPDINVMEIGFNAGHSAEVFLKNNDALHLTSFDLGMHNYVLPAKQYINETYPNRHILILGDSTKTVPEYYNKNKDIKFDVIFIDGGHDYKIAQADMKNCLRFAHPETILIVDDIMCKSEWEAPWTTGPTQTWREHISENKIIELGRSEYYSGRGMAWGKYIL